MLQVLNQDETPLLYSLVFGEGVVNDATSVVLLKAIQNFDLSHIDLTTGLHLIGNFFYLFTASTALGVFVILYLSPIIFLLLLVLVLARHYKLIFVLFSFQAGLLSAFIIKKLYFGRLAKLKQTEFLSTFSC